MQAGSHQMLHALEDKPLFRLVNGQLDVFAGEFCNILTSGEMTLDSDTMDAVSISGHFALARIRVGLLLFHFCSFWRRIRRPLLRWPRLSERAEMSGPQEIPARREAHQRSQKYAFPGGRIAYSACYADTRISSARLEALSLPR